jgi:hypothetical protein
MLAGFTQNEAGLITGVATMAVSDGHFEKLTESGQDPYWLNDSKRMIFVDDGKLYLIRLGQATRKLILAPKAGLSVERRGFAVSKDNAWIYYSGSRVESEVWMGEVE